MSDHFTCPSCGWPHGPTHTQERFYEQDGVMLDWKYERYRHAPTDAKEGEEDGPNSSNADPGVRGGGDRGQDNLATLTPDIAGLVERLRARPWDTECHPDSIVFRLCHEAADALERLNNLVGVQVAQSFYRDLCKARAEIERLRSQSDVEDYNETKAENERLRAALELIAAMPNSDLDTPASIARAALTGRGDDPEDDYADRAEWQSRRGE